MTRILHHLGCFICISLLCCPTASVLQLTHDCKRHAVLYQQVEADVQVIGIAPSYVLRHVFFCKQWAPLRVHQHCLLSCVLAALCSCRWHSSQQPSCNREALQCAQSVPHLSSGKVQHIRVSERGATGRLPGMPGEHHRRYAMGMSISPGPLTWLTTMGYMRVFCWSCLRPHKGKCTRGGT